jgi:hypothetical protein
MFCLIDAMKARQVSSVMLVLIFLSSSNLNCFLMRSANAFLGPSSPWVSTTLGLQGATYENHFKRSV